MISLFLLAFTLIMLGLGISIAQMRSGSSVLGQRTRRSQSFTTALHPEEAVMTIIHFAQQDGYKIPAVDLDNNELVLEEPTSVMNWGFFFPVIVTRQSDKSTLVEIGIKSKFYQYGPIVSRSHERCINGIKSALYARCDTTLQEEGQQRPCG